MKRITTIIIIFVLLFSVSACDNGGKLTVERVLEIAAEKGEALTWSDFEQYKSKEIGSGLYILLYEIDSDYELMIGGVPNETPMYIRLVSVVDSESYVDVRYDDVDTFMTETESET